MGDREDYRAESSGGAASDEVRGGFLKSIVDIFVDPEKVFQRIEYGLTWWKPFILAAVVGIVIAFLMMPFQKLMFELTSRDRMSAEELQRSLEIMEKTKFVAPIVYPVLMLLVILAVAGIAYLLINLMSANASYKKTLSLIYYCGIVLLIWQILSAGLVFLKGVDNIESPADMMMSLSLATFFSGLKPGLYALLESFGLFQVWFYILFVFGAASVFKLGKKSAIITAVPFWVLFYLYSYLNYWGINR
jgi:hypothetical protein